MNQRTALITGSSRGIGRGIALALAKAGYNVIINYRQDDAAATEALNEAGKFSRAIKIKADIRFKEQIEEMYKKATCDFGFVDTIINNAGVHNHGLFIDETDEQFNKVFDTNLVGTINVTRRFLPDMLANRFGRIVNISSVWGISGASMEVTYSVTKAALIGLTKALSKEYAPMGVTVNAIAPGAIKTDMLKNLTQSDLKHLTQNIMAGRLGQPLDIAKAAEFFASKEADYVTGQVLTVDGDFMPIVRA